MERTTLTERLRRAETEIAAGRPEQALAYCQELQTAYPRAVRVQRVLGEIYLALRRPREALAALDRAFAGDPEDVRACCARALVHQMHGDNISALAWYRRACDLRPDDQSLRATYRDLARRLGEPPYRPSRAGLARLYLRGDQFAHAIREWEQLVNESPDMLDAQVGLAETLWLAGHARAAEERCRRILANAPSCVKAMLIQMALALAEGDMDAARAHLQRTTQLDPDMAIAQMFFADALAAGDPVLTALLRGDTGAENVDETVRMGNSTAGFAQSSPLAGSRNLSRPLVASAPNTGGPAFGAPPSSQPLPPPPRPEIPAPSQPTEVTRAIKETAFMIWGKDDDSQPRIAAQQTGAARDAEPVAPVLRDLSSAADDDETKRALNWYNWLQAQGAVALGGAVSSPAPERPRSTTKPIPGIGAPTSAPSVVSGPVSGAVNGNPAHGAPAPVAGSPRLTMPIPPTRQTMPLMPAELQGLTPQDEEQETIPLPSADLLRTMFAELGSKTGAPPVAPVGQVAADPIPLDITPDPHVVESLAPQPNTADTVDMPERVYDAAPATSAVDEVRVVDDEPFNGFTAADEQEMRQSQQLPETLEALERQFSASGFTPIETRPGLLAEIERTQQSGGSVVLPPPSPPEQPESADPASATPAAPAAPATPERDEPPLSVKSGPDPHDYPARLTHARKRRDDGQLDDALNEYRAIIKNAPDLLPEVLSDLRASLAETPDHPNLHSVLGDALVCQGDYEQALESYNKAMELAQARSEGA